MMIELKRLKNNFLFTFLIILMFVIFLLNKQSQLTTTSFINDNSIRDLFTEYSSLVEHNFLLEIKVIDENYFSLLPTDLSGIFITYNYKDNVCNLVVYKNTKVQTALTNFLESEVEFKTILFHEFSHCLQSYNFNIKKDSILLKGLSAEIFADGMAISLNKKNADTFLLKRINTNKNHSTYQYLQNLNCFNGKLCYKKIFDIAKNIF